MAPLKLPFSMALIWFFTTFLYFRQKKKKMKPKYQEMSKVRSWGKENHLTFFISKLFQPDFRMVTKY